MPPHVQPDLHESLASWQSGADVAERSPEIGVAEEDVRIKQRRLGFMCLTSMESYDTFYADLKAYVETGSRDPKHQQRVDDYAAFALKVYEESVELILQRGIQYLVEGPPRTSPQINKDALNCNPSLGKGGLGYRRRPTRRPMGVDCATAPTTQEARAS